MALIIYLLVSLVLLQCIPIIYSEVGSPVILVPGDGGSQIEAKLNKPEAPHRWCTKKSDWFPIWLNLELMVPYVLDCFVDNMKLQYNPKTKRSSNAPGVSTRQMGFGNTSAVEWLDSSQISPTNYFYDIAQALVNQGYKRNLNIRGAPYDFRKAPNEMEGFVRKLGKLVEKTYTHNGNKKVVLIAHSMGNPYVLYLLSKQSQAWKDKFVKAFVAMAAPLGGAVKTLRMLTSGDNLGAIIVNPMTVRPMQRSFISSMWLIPYEDEEFWGPNDVLISNGKRNYTVRDYDDFFKDIGFPEGAQVRKDIAPLMKYKKHPGVEVHCLHGINVKTIESLTYKPISFPDDQPVVQWGNGDGTVNKRSLYGCLRWKTQKSPYEVYHKEINNADHLGLLSNHDAISYIKKVVMS